MSPSTKRARREKQEEREKERRDRAVLFEPNLILQVTGIISSRIKEYLEEDQNCEVCFVPPKNVTVLLFVRSPNPEVKLQQQLSSSSSYFLFLQNAASSLTVA